MKKSMFTKVSIIFALIISLLVPMAATEASAATTYSGTVKVSSTTVREKASSSSKKLGTLKKGSIVNVYSKTKSGWSEVYYKNKKAYILTKHLKTSKKISFLMDKSKVYVYENAQGGTASMKYSRKKSGWNIWKNRLDNKDVYSEKETKKGIEEKNGSLVATVITYPLYVGKTENFINDKTKITSLTKTIKTPAGTFKNVVELKALRSGYTYYLAPGVGLILSKKGKKKDLELAVLKSEAKVKADEKTLKTLITRNAANAEKEDFDAYMKDVSKKLRTDESFIAHMNEHFEKYDLKYEVQDIKILSLTNTKAIVEVKHKETATYILDGYHYRNNITTTMHSIIKEGGKFVFDESYISDIEYLD